MRVISIDAKRGKVVVDVDGLELTIQEAEDGFMVEQPTSSRSGWLTKSLLSIACHEAAKALAEARVKQLSFKF